MGGQVVKVISGIGLLIFVFLILNNYKATVEVINSIAKNSISGISVLQGKDVG
jgi:anaerobic C4-dicarboxylate transporter